MSDPEYQAELIRLYKLAEANAKRIAELEADNARLRVDAAVGAVVWKYIDRMNDVVPSDPAERILCEFCHAVQPVMDAAKDEPAWVQRSMELAMVTGQRRQSISEAQFKEPSEIGDDGAMWVDGDWLCIHQGKGGNRLRIPLSLRLDAFGWSVWEVVKKCRDRTISKYMIHHGHEHTRRLKTNQVYIDTISKAFARCRDASGLDWGGKEPPTFHEIRSLSERLYKSEGRVNTQELLGHKDPRMTRVYHDPRGAEFIDVAVR